MSQPNLDPTTVTGFGDEWSRFDQRAADPAEIECAFDEYFRLFPWSSLPPRAIGFDLGCGSGRWARLVAPRVGLLHCVDASAQALGVARRHLVDGAHLDNCRFHCASVEAMPFPDESMDFGYALGVLHHVPDTAAGIRACVQKLKPGAPLLVYLYYALDNRPVWYRSLWRASDALRSMISRLPHGPRHAITQALAATVYWPLARLAFVLERAGLDPSALPLAYYRDRSFYIMRTDARDRFGTPLEHRFTRDEIRTMLSGAGLEDITFSDRPPFWCAVARRAAR